MMTVNAISTVEDADKILPVLFLTASLEAAHAKAKNLSQTPFWASRRSAPTRRSMLTVVARSHRDTVRWSATTTAMRGYLKGMLLQAFEWGDAE